MSLLQSISTAWQKKNHMWVVISLDIQIYLCYTGPDLGVQTSIKLFLVLISLILFRWDFNLRKGTTWRKEVLYKLQSGVIKATKRYDSSVRDSWIVYWKVCCTYSFSPSSLEPSSSVPRALSFFWKPVEKRDKRCPWMWHSLHCLYKTIRSTWGAWQFPLLQKLNFWVMDFGCCFCGDSTVH